VPRESPGNVDRERRDQVPTWLLVLIIVLIVFALFGGFGYYRR
jgi:hypothetical protein